MGGVRRQGLAAAQAEPVLTFKSTHDLLPADDIHWVEFYEDGTVLIHYPVYMKKAGDYVVQLSADEILDILRLLVDPLVLNFDREQVEAEKEEIDAESPVVYAISDNSYSEFEISLRINGSSVLVTSDQLIRWANLNLDKDRYPEIEVLGILAEIEAILMSLADHPAARRLD